MLAVIAGVALGAAFVAFARLRGPRTELWIYAIGLVVAAVIYLGFATLGVAGTRWTAVEAAGIVPYTAFAWLGLRYASPWLAIGWLLHAAWDVGLHLVAGTPGFVPAWYPVTCIGFDLVVAVTIAARAGVWRPVVDRTVQR